MDIHGGKGICMGPNNYLGRAYQTMPIAITVEGANILTRSLIIFGQGAIRCHPLVLKEIEAAGANDLAAFDARALGPHRVHGLQRRARAVAGHHRRQGHPGAGLAGDARATCSILTRFSSAFALLADMSMFVIGGSLKRKEKLSARLGDILSLLYMVSATVKRFHDEGRQKEDLPLLTWAMYDSFFKLQVAMDGVLANFPNRSGRVAAAPLVFPKGLTLTAPHDKWASRVAAILISRAPRATASPPASTCRAGRTTSSAASSSRWRRSSRPTRSRRSCAPRRRKASCRSARSPSAATPP